MDARAEKMWAAGDSGDVIALALGLTKNMICGHALRNRDRFPARINAGNSNDAPSHGSWCPTHRAVVFVPSYGRRELAA
jgi:hypothetical protein